MQKGDKASLSIILAGRALLVKMLITLESHGIFGSSLVDSCILTLSSDWYEISFVFLIQFNVPFKIISLIETSQSVGGAKREYPGKTT